MSTRPVKTGAIRYFFDTDVGGIVPNIQNSGVKTEAVDGIRVVFRRLFKNSAAYVRMSCFGQSLSVRHPLEPPLFIKKISPPKLIYLALFVVKYPHIRTG